MSDINEENANNTVDGKVVTMDIGKTLRNARKKKGLDIPDVTAQLHIQKNYISALENNNFDKLPQPAFVKGYIRTYAKFLGLKAIEDIVCAYEKQTGCESSHVILNTCTDNPRLDINELNKNRFWESCKKSPLCKKIALSLLGLLAFCILSLLLLFKLKSPSKTDNTPAQEQSILSQQPAVNTMMAAEETTHDASNTHNKNTTKPETSPNNNPSTATIGANTTQSTPSKPTKKAPSDTRHYLQITAKQQAWIKIEQSGSIVFKGLLEQGERFEKKITPPINVRIGNAPHVEVAYEGQSIDLSPHINSKSNVAKLKLVYQE